MAARDAEPDEEPRGELTVRTMAMPADTNANGDIFGGWVLSQMDQAGGIAGVERAEGRVVTIAVDAMTFIRPVKVGDVLCVYTNVESRRPHLDEDPYRGLGPALPPQSAREGDGRDLHLRRHRRGRPPATDPTRQKHQETPREHHPPKPAAPSAASSPP